MSSKISISAQASTSNVPKLEAGVYVARCYSMIHIGTAEENILGKTKRLNKVRLYWELPSEMIIYNEEKGEQPRAMSKEFTLSLHEKSNLRKFLEAWRGKSFNQKELDDFELTNLIGATCMITVIHKEGKDGNTYVEISSVSKIMKGVKCDDQINDSVIFGYDPFEQDVFDTFPDWIKEKIQRTDEYKAAVSGENAVETTAPADHEPEVEVDDLPF